MRAYSEAPSLFALRYEGRQTLLKSSLITKLTLPNDRDAKSERMQGLRFPLISSPIGGNFLDPPLMIGSRQTFTRARFVTVPKAAVHENAPSLGLVRYIRPPREIMRAFPEASTEVVQKAANRLLWASVALLYRFHSYRLPRSLLRRRY